MSNPLFASHMMQMAYIGKEQPPAGLLGLWTLQGNLNDLSRYGRHLQSTTTPTYGTGGLGQYGTLITCGIDVTLSGDFTIEAMGAFGWSDDTGSYLSFGNSAIGTTAYDYGNEIYEWIYNGSSKSRISVGTDYTAFHHFALVRSSGVIRYYVNGTYRTSVNDSSTINGVNITLYNSVLRLQNFRIVQKALGTTSSFPVPSTLYTGYETL